MNTITAVITTNESGSVTSETYTSTNYETKVEMSHYGSPWLGEYIDSEAYRAALGEYVVSTIQTIFHGIGPSHGWSLPFVNEPCSVYVFEVDFDS